MGFVVADYENGVLRPRSPLRLRPGERVGILVVRRPDPDRWNLDRQADSLSQEDTELTESGLAEWADALDLEDRR
jgi:predicted DNA-binding antitoxin AbrB/MazE fold protein